MPFIFFDFQPAVTALSVAWAVYFVILAVWIILQKRAPVATLSWIMCLALLPYIGFAIYYFLGPQRMKKQRSRRLRSQAHLFVQADIASLRKMAEDAPPSMQALARLGTATCGIPVSTATSMVLLVGGDKTFDAIFEAIRRARHHVHLEYYVLEPDQIGTALAQLLIEKSHQGVTVRLLVDALGSQDLRRSFIDPMVKAGVQFAWFHDTRIGRRWRPVTNYRTHRKIVVCDGQVGFTGGINFTDEEDPRARDDAYHDVHLRLEGSVVRWLQLTFLEDWTYSTGEPAEKLVDTLPRLMPSMGAGTYLVQILTSGPDSAMESIHRMYVAAIDGALSRVWLTTPYFVPGEPALMALTSASLRGVDVRVMVPRRSDSLVVSAAARSYYDELIAAGVRIDEYKDRMLHSKTLVVDDNCAFIGTANFDNRSFRLNYEVCAVVYGPALALQLAQQFEVDLKTCSGVRAHRRQPLLRRLGDATARLFSPLL